MTFSEFMRKHDPMAYNVATSKRWLAIIYADLGYRSTNKPWSDDELEMEAKKYSTRAEFVSNNNGAYVTACARGKEFLDKICAHMTWIRKNKFSDEELETEAKKYSNRKEFVEKGKGAYAAACSRGKEFLDRICAHMERTRIEKNSLTKEIIMSEAKKYTSHKEWKTANGSSYVRASRMGWMDEATLHFPQTRTNWTKDKIVEEILTKNIQSLKDWKNKSKLSYVAAQRYGWLQDLKRRYNIVNQERRKPVLQLDSGGNIVKRWGSILEIQKMNKYKFQNISSCCNGKAKSAYGYKWKFDK